jgi:predicted Fe-Mo cluster-binding NifX family protein
MDLRNAVIAIVTDDGTTVSSHFGRARFYEVITLTDGKVIKRERREKAGHHTFASEEAEGEHEHEHGHGESHERRHQTMVSPILDCRAVIVRGMGQGAVDHLRSANLIPVLTNLDTIDEVISAIATGSLDHDERRIHQHGHGHR